MDNTLVKVSLTCSALPGIAPGGEEQKIVLMHPALRRPIQPSACCALPPGQPWRAAWINGRRQPAQCAFYASR